MKSIAEIIAHCDLPRLEAELLLAYVLKTNKTWIFLNPNISVTDDQENQFKYTYNQRKQGIPIAQIIARKEFFGLEFNITNDVLIPRPCTEYIVEKAIQVYKNPSTEESYTEIDTKIVAWTHIWKSEAVELVADIGTGSGAIACALAKNIPHCTIIATDVSNKALHLAQKNAELLQVERHITFKLGNNIEPILNICKPFLVVSNPPYIPNAGYIEQNVALYEPSIALFGGELGIDTLLEIVKAAYAHPYCIGFIIECREEQPAIVQHALRKN